MTDLEFVKRPKKLISTSARRVFFVAALIVSFLGGLFYGDLSGRNSATEANSVLEDLQRLAGQASGMGSQYGKDVDFSMYWRIRNLLKDKYLRVPIEDQDMFYGSLSGMVAALGDPYTTFFDPKEAEDFSNQLSGKFEGIGAEIAIKNNFLIIVAPLPESPALKAGLRAKDIIVKIDDVDTTGMSTEEAVTRIKGPSDTEVVLTIYRDGFDEPKPYTIKRAEIVFKSVRSKITSEKFAVIELFHFNEETPALFAEAVTEALNKKVKGVILDLRNNPGGILESAVEVAGEWLPTEGIVQEKNKNGITDTLVAYGSGRLKGVPTVVLVNGGSASASEIVSGALQDYEVATLVGEQTFGKGSVQELNEVGSGAELKITVAEWLTGKGRSIDKVGVAPDVVVEMTKDDFNYDRDPQMDKALAILRKAVKK
ncbi:MAG: S41 family peptidase [bacterium]